MGGKLSLNNKHNGNNLKNKREQSKQFSGPRLSLDEVYESLEDYKETINNIYCLNDILDDYSDDIIEKHNEGDLNPINSVLLSTLHESYDKNAAINYCEVIELAKASLPFGEPI